MKLKSVLLSFAILSAGGAFAQDDFDHQQKYLTVSKIKVKEVSRDFLNQEIADDLYSEEIGPKALPIDGAYFQNPLADAGKVIQIGRDLVALGQEIYRLVKEAKPSNTTSYTPISVIPKENNQPVDIFDTEGWKVPVKRTYEVVYENTYGMDVVTFRYSVIFSYGGKYKGKGAYLTAAQIIPESIHTMIGFTFNAQMKLGGIQNAGTKDDPIAAAVLLLQYTTDSIMTANLSTTQFYITGRGEFKRL